MKSNQLYDWNTLFRKKVFTLLEGEDFDCTCESMEQQVRNAASRRGLRVIVVLEDGTVSVVVRRHKEPKDA